ncbi:MULTISPECIES: HIRAN domain-containing protein [Flammeovirga]|uniref:HIRAN domain-containing protein n=1 Tax=Flammeovirga agarivorans TaxID=2726742 RepID=A0A7X8XUP3_9BACT|nr:MULTISPECIES: HIRAN domain-containing protein [Flammeovirga]NLR90558.1 hypothetical protein [Flammeovirga agarivorans]
MVKPKSYSHDLLDNVEKELLFEGYLSGYRHYAEWDQEWEIMRHPLKLVRHSTNPFDQHAIAVFADSKMIGYVPKSSSEKISILIDKGASIYAELVDVFPNAETQKKVFFRIWNYKVTL